MLDSFKSLIQKNFSYEMNISDQDTLSTLVNMSTQEKKLFSNTLYYEYGCKCEPQLLDSNNEEIRDGIWITGKHSGMVLNMIYKHPSFKSDMDIVSWYPNYWTRIQEVNQKEQEGFIIDLPNDCNILSIIFIAIEFTNIKDQVEKFSVVWHSLLLFI